MVIKKKVNEHQLIASICRDSFWDFVMEFWEYVIAEKPVWNWHMEYLANEMQTMAERVFAGLPKEYDAIFNVPPGTSKSTICSVMFPMWTWTRMPSCRSLCGSYAYPLALDLSRKSRDLLNSEKFQKCFPDIQLRTDQDTKGYFANTKGGARYAFGVNGSVLGMHGHFIIVDDPLDPNRATSDTELKSTNSWMRETLSGRKVDKAVTAEILVMQRLHQNDPSGDRLSNKKLKVRHVCMPAKVSGHVNPPELKSRYVNDLLDPVRLSNEVLENAKTTLLEYGYACQYDQNPIPRGGGMFKTDRFTIVPNAPRHLKRVVRYWDKAGTSGGGAFTVGVKMAIDEEPGNKFYIPKYYILGVERVQFESMLREKLIKSTAERDGVRTHIWIEQEPGSSGKDSVYSTIRMLAGYAAKPDRVSGDKELRADTYSCQVNAGNVFLVQGLWNDDFIEEHKFFPYSKYKDQVDSASGAFNMLCRPKIRIGALGGQTDGSQNPTRDGTAA